MIRTQVMQSIGLQNQDAISTIIFDLGNVLIDIDLNKTLKKFRDLGVSNFDDLYNLKKQTSVFEQWESGTISANEFRNHLRVYISGSPTDDAIDDAWKAMLSSFTEERINLLKKVKTKYQVFLLSNTNEMHVNAFVDDAEEKYGKDIFKQLFHKTYYSNEIHLRKPSVDIYHYVINDAKLNPSKTLFIDDLQVNVDGAIKAGLHGYCLVNKNISEVFSFD